MKYVWNYIENKNWKTNTKYNAFLWTSGILSALLGFIIWNIIKIWTLNTWDWMLLFTGYPGIVAWYLAAFYCFNHSFPEGK